MPPFPSAPSSPATNIPQNVAADLLLSLSGNEYPSKRRRRPPLIPLRRQKPLKTSPQTPSDPSPATIPLKTSPQASSDPSPATNNPQNVAAGLLLSLSGNEYPSKRRRRSPFIPLRQRIPLKTSSQISFYPSPATNNPQSVAAGRGGNSDPSVRHLF